MYTFNVSKSNGNLIVTSNTFWSCNVYGNLRLSKYSGKGNDIIKITVPKEMPYGNGTIVFSYGDERCEYPSIDVYLINDCYIRTEPMFNTCEDGNVLKLVFDEDNEAISIKVYSNGIWTASEGFKNGDELLIMASDKKVVTITPNIGCSETVKVILEKRSDE